jgi:hypothetical protein
LPVPTLSLSGCIFSDVAGGWPTVAGSGALASGVLAAGGRSEGLLPLSLEAGGVAAGLAALGKSGAYSWADAIAALTNNAAAVHIMFFIMAVLSGC